MKVLLETLRRVHRNVVATEQKAILPVANLAGERLRTSGSPCDYGAVFAFQGGGHGFHDSAELRRARGLEENVDRATASETIGYVGGVVKEGGVTLDDGAVAHKPWSFANDLSFEAAAGDGTDVGTLRSDGNAGAGAAIARPFNADQGGKRKYFALLPQFHDLAAFDHVWSFP
jgi:hypothetical protein